MGTDLCAPTIMITDDYCYSDDEDDYGSSFYYQFHTENPNLVDAGSQSEGQTSNGV